MPTSRKPSIPGKGHRVPNGATGFHDPATGAFFAASRTPHAAVVEACSQSAHTYQPENALRVVELYTGAGESIDAMSTMLRVQGKKTVEEFYLHPGVGELLVAMGDQLAKYRAVVDDARAAFENLHKEDLERIRNPQRGQERWDIAVNRE